MQHQASSCPGRYTFPLESDTIWVCHVHQCRLYHVCINPYVSIKVFVTWQESCDSAYHSPACILPPINGSTYRWPSLACCVYCLPALLVLIGSTLPSDRLMFAFAVCLGKSLLSSNRPSYSNWYKVQRMPASSWCGAASSCGCTQKVVRNWLRVIFSSINLFTCIFNKRWLQQCEQTTELCHVLYFSQS